MGIQSQNMFKWKTNKLLILAQTILSFVVHAGSSVFGSGFVFVFTVMFQVSFDFCFLVLSLRA